MNEPDTLDTSTKGMNNPIDGLVIRPHTVERARVSKHAAGRTKAFDKKTKARRKRRALKITRDAALDASALRKALNVPQ